MDILSKIKQSGLVGRGGASFPVWQKWDMVKKATEGRETTRKKCYIVCNASEGEPGVEKDGYILENWPEKVIDGIKTAIDFLKADKAFIYLNSKYYNKFNKKLNSLISNTSITLFIKPYDSGYIGGEESAVLNAIEIGLAKGEINKKIEPRLRPPFPTTEGLWESPTLINNVETFYNINLVQSGQYKKERFYTINGDCPNEGVYLLAENYTIEHILKSTKNYPRFTFFVQVGGSASGEVLNSNQLKRSVIGSGSITVYSIEKYSYKKLIKNWLEFFCSESCGLCTPCREGLYRLKEISLKEKGDWQLLNELISNLSEASFCGLGLSAAVPIVSFIKNVLPIINKSTNPI